MFIPAKLAGGGKALKGSSRRVEMLGVGEGGGSGGVPDTAGGVPDSLGAMRRGSDCVTT